MDDGIIPTARFVITGLGFGSWLNRGLQKGKPNYVSRMIPNRASLLKVTQLFGK
jgi:hypothetical protein